MKHTGSIEDLITIISGTGHKIISKDEKGAGYQIKTEGGGICNWFPSTGTLDFQGKPDARDKLKNAIGEYTGQATNVAPVTPPEDLDPKAPLDIKTANKKVFVVHGHDATAREQLELVLHKLGLDPFVLANTGGGGLTIIEALENEMGVGRKYPPGEVHVVGGRS